MTTFFAMFGLPVFITLALLGMTVVFFVLIVRPKNQVVMLMMLPVVGLITIVLLAVVFAFLMYRDAENSRPASGPPAQTTSANGSSSEVAKAYESVTQINKSLLQEVPRAASNAFPASPPPGVMAPTDASEKGEDEVSQAVASKTVGMLRAMIRALGRALVEEEKNLAVKKDPAEAIPSPASGGRHEVVEAGGEGGRATDKTALTLTLSQRERGPNSTLSQRERGQNSILSQGEKGRKIRPAWLGAPPQLVDNVYQMTVCVGPYTTRAECDAQLPDALQKALEQYAEVCLGDRAAGSIRLPADDLRQQLVKDLWQETRQYSVGPMIQLHALLQFDRKVKDFVLETHRQAIVGQRLQAVTVWAMLGLSLLTVLFGYLKIDVATGGIYRSRLRFAAIAAILGIVAAVAVGYG